MSKRKTESRKPQPALPPPPPPDNLSLFSKALWRCATRRGGEWPIERLTLLAVTLEGLDDYTGLRNTEAPAGLVIAARQQVLAGWAMLGLAGKAGENKGD